MCEINLMTDGLHVEVQNICLPVKLVMIYMNMVTWNVMSQFM